MTKNAPRELSLHAAAVWMSIGTSMRGSGCSVGVRSLHVEFWAPGLDWNGAIVHGILWAKTDGTVGNVPVDQSQFECQSTPSSTCASPLSTRLSAALSGVSVHTSNRTMKITQCALQRDEFDDFACSLMLQTDRIPAPNMPRFCSSHQNPQRAEST
jgi:hypothetical protein